MKRYFLLLTLLLGITTVNAQQTMDLSGTWQFSMGDEPRYDDMVTLPGSMLTNGKGNRVSVNTQWTGSLYDSSFYFNPYMERYRREGEMKFPFFLTPSRHYTGNAWYKRMVGVPKSWKKQRIVLFLERPHIETTVFVNGREVGQQTSLSVPHKYDVTPYIRFGSQNEIAIRVYNGIENVCVGQDSHSVTDQTQGNWNGLAGRIELQAHQPGYLKGLRVYPDVAAGNVRVELKREGSGKTRLWVEGRQKQAVTTADSTVLIPMPDALLWDEFQPNLYTLVAVQNGDTLRTTFGMRQISIEGRQLVLNGRPIFLRGTVENCLFPETGYPPTDEQEWLRIVQKCKDYGLNHIRFHSYCPPEAAFSAADRLGLYLQPEGPSWPNHGVKLRRGMAIDQYLLDEGRRMLDAYGNHPSFLMMAAGNEPAGDWVPYVADWVKEMKDYDPTKLYCGASVGGGWAWDAGSDYHVKGGARGLDEWNKRAPSSADDYYSGIEFPRNYKETAPNQSPIVTHEKGQWCAFPDFKEIPQYTGAYKARNFEIFRDLLRDNGMEPMAEKFLMASGRLQTLCYKYEIERHLRTPDYAGFQLLGLNDYSGQGSALVGVLNVHWREKGYCDARQWTQWCSPVVPLARFPKFVFTADERIEIPVDVYNAYKEPLQNARIVWRIEGTTAQGQGEAQTLPIGRTPSVITIRHQAASQQEQPSKLRLLVSIESDNHARATNSYDFWIYPQQVAMPDAAGIYQSDTLDAQAVQVLQQGGTVLLTAAGRVTLGSDVKQTYLPVFWNTSWFKMRPPHTTGAYIEKDHPLFKYGFPTDDWSNLNWWELLNRAQVMNLMELPATYQPPIQPIDTWHVSRKLGMLVEARVGQGRVLITTMDISSRLAERPVARQMRRAILSYMQSPDFQPSLQLTPDVVGHFFTKQAPPVNMFTNDSPDELKPKIK